MHNRRVIIESPLSGDFILNRHYARLAMHHALSLGEDPYASHLLYDQPGILDDTIPAERVRGIEAGLHWGDASAEATVVYTDLGTSGGMKLGITRAEAVLRPVEYRTLPDWGPARARFEAQRPLHEAIAALQKVIARG